MNAIPWYKSAVLRGIVAAAVLQIIKWAKDRYHIDASAFGITADAATDFAMNAISAGALYYAAHGRVTKPLPPLTLTKAAATAINTPAISLYPTTPAAPAPTEISK